MSNEKRNVSTRWSACLRPRRLSCAFCFSPLSVSAFVALLLLVSGRPVTGAQQMVWELTPYKIRVWVAWQPSPELTPRLAERMYQALVERTDAVVGAGWLLQAESAPAELQPRMLRALGDLPFEALPAAVVESDEGKLMMLAVHADHGRYRLEAREFDLHTRQAGTLVVRPVAQRSLVFDEAFQALLDAFAPLTQIEEVEKVEKPSAPSGATSGDAAANGQDGAASGARPGGTPIKLRLRAGGLATVDGSLTWIRPRDVFRPVLRTNDREGKLKKVQPLDWTLIVVENVDGSLVEGTLYSGLRSPLSGRRRGRVEQLALLGRSTGGATRLELHTRGENPRPLAGYLVYAHPADSTATVLVGRTDIHGSVVVPPEPSHPVRVLLVKHGGEPLARLPLVPGLTQTATAQVLDDDQRLAAEGVVVGLQENFVDLVIKREVLKARIAALLDENKLDEAKKLLEELRKLGREDDFRIQVRQEQSKIFSSDQRQQAKIKKLFSGTLDVVHEFFNQSTVDALERRLFELQRAASGLPAATAQPAAQPTAAAPNATTTPAAAAPSATPVTPAGGGQ